MAKGAYFVLSGSGTVTGLKNPSAEWFGATPGAINDTAIKAAIASVTTGKGSTIHIPESLIASTIVVNKADVTVTSDGQKVSFDSAFAKIGSGTYGLYNVMFAVTADKVNFVNWSYDQGSFTDSSSFIWYDTGADYGIVNKNKFSGGPFDIVGGVYGVTNGVAVQLYSGSSGVKVTENTFNDCSGSVSAQGSNHIVDNNTSFITSAQATGVVGATDQAYGLDGCTGCSLTNNKVIHGAGAPYSGTNMGVNSLSTNFFIANNYVYGITGGRGILAVNSNYGTISNNIVDAGGVTGVASWSLIEVDADSTNVKVTGNVMRNAPVSGSSHAGSGLTISTGNNEASDNSSLLGTSTKITAGISVNPATTAGSLSIERNKIANNGRGIYFVGVTNNNMIPITISGNTYNDPITAAITEDGSMLPNCPIYMENETINSASIGAYPIAILKYKNPFNDGAWKFPFRITRNTVMFSAVAPTDALYFAGSTWEQGDTLYNILPATGQPKGWVCTKTGTFGAFSEAGTTTSGSPIVTGLTDTSDIYVGDFIDATAGFATLTILRVIAKTSTTITVDRNANASGAVTLSTTDPVWTAMPNL